MPEHYFSAEPTGPVRGHEVRATIWGEDYRFASADGVFSARHLDHATAVLLREVAPPTHGRILDLGCGYGPIALAIARTSPGTEVWAVDVNQRALDLTSTNAEAMALSVQVRRPEDVPEDLAFDQIWSNPPIRIGKDALHALLLAWLPRLTPEGSAVLVVGKNLGADSLQRWLLEQGFGTTRLASAKGFRVLKVTPKGA